MPYSCPGRRPGCGYARHRRAEKLGRYGSEPPPGDGCGTPPTSADRRAGDRRGRVRRLMPELRQARLALPAGGRIGDNEPPAIIRERRERQRTLATEPNLCVGMIEAAADRNIGQHEMLRISAAQESDRQLLADGAVRPVAAEKPIGLDVLDPVAGAQAGRDAAIALRHRDQFGIALDPDAVSSEVLFENLFGLVLRYAENKRVAGVERTEPGMRDAPVLAVYADTIDAMTGAEEIFGEAHQ